MANRLGIRGRVIELYVRFFDAAGNPANADTTPQVEIYDSAGTRRQRQTNIGVTLADDPGLYKFTYTVPLNSIDGYWSDVWTAQMGDETITNTFDFQVISSGTALDDSEPEYMPGDDVPWDFCKEEIYGVNRLLKMLKCRVKNNGVRKVPDGQGGYVEIPCNVFTDAELICFLVNSLSSFNQYPHFTQFTFANSQIYTIFAEIIVQGAVLLALAAQSLVEKGREFTMVDNGISYQPPAVADMLNTQYSTQLGDYKEKLKMIKKSLPPVPKGLGTFRVTAISPAFLRLRHLRQRQIL